MDLQFLLGEGLYWVAGGCRALSRHLTGLQLALAHAAALLQAEPLREHRRQLEAQHGHS